MQEYGKSVNYYNLLIQSNKVNDYRVYFNLAMCYEKLGDNLKATENYQQVTHLPFLNPQESQTQPRLLKLCHQLLQSPHVHGQVNPSQVPPGTLPQEQPF